MITEMLFCSFSKCFHSIIIVQIIRGNQCSSYLFHSDHQKKTEMFIVEQISANDYRKRKKKNKLSNLYLFKKIKNNCMLIEMKKFSSTIKM